MEVGYPHVSQSDVHFLVMGILERKVWNSTSLYTLKWGHGLHFSLGSPFYIQLFIEPGVESPCTFIVGLAASLAIPPSRRLECSLPVEDRNVSNSVLHTEEMKAEFVRILSHVQSFLDRKSVV